MPFFAITREVSATFNQCELTHRQREPIDLAAARKQHRSYEAGLEALGCSLLRLPEAPALPDAVFVEDTAIVLPELAVITRPGAASRRPETASVAEALRPFRRLLAIEPPGTLDGGDVLRLGRTLYVGLSGRSDPSGLEQLRDHLAPFGYRVRGVPVRGCLHLKTAVTEAADGMLLLNRQWVEAGAFEAERVIEVDPAEPFAANALRIGTAAIYPAAFPRTRRRLEDAGVKLHLVDVSELAKAEGAVTCCSLIFEV